MAAVAFNFTTINSGVMRARLRRAMFPHFVLKGERPREKRLSGTPRWRGWHHAMGETTVSSDAGLLLPRELDERLGLSAQIEQHLTDPPRGTRPPLSAAGPPP